MGVQQMDKQKLVDRLGDNQTSIVDVRTNWAASKRKIPGAVHETADRVADWAGRYDPALPVVVYCSAPGEADSQRVADALDKAGFQDVSFLSGGWWVWESAGFPTEKRDKEPLPKGVVPGVGKP